MAELLWQTWQDILAPSPATSDYALSPLPCAYQQRFFTSIRLTLPDILVRLTFLPITAAALIGLGRYRQLTPERRILTLGIAGFLLPMDLAGFVLLLREQDNLFLMPLFTVGELWVLALVYKNTLQSPAFSRLMPWLVGGFTCYVLLDSWLGPGITRFRPSQQVLQSFLILVLVGLYFRKLLNDLQVIKLSREPMFWVSAGLLIYFLGYLQIALFSNYLLYYSYQLNMNVWMIHSLLFIVLYCCYCRALWLSPQK